MKLFKQTMSTQAHTHENNNQQPRKYFLILLILLDNDLKVLIDK